MRGDPLGEVNRPLAYTPVGPGSDTPFTVQRVDQGKRAAYKRHDGKFE